MNGTTPANEQTDGDSADPDAPSSQVVGAGSAEPSVEQLVGRPVEEPADQPVEEMVDTLPEDLDRTFGAPYEFPDNKRRRIPGMLYILTGLIVGGWALSAGSDAVLVNGGLLAGCAALILIGLWHVLTAYPLEHDENEALVVATRGVGFAVGHASAQLGWRGLLSRPTWRILLYSAEDPPEQRGLVLVDAVDGRIIDQFTESNPEDWSDLIESVPAGGSGGPDGAEPLPGSGTEPGGAE